MRSFFISAWGHPNVTATHKSTWEITKDDHLGPNGDCIVGINATHAVKDFPEDFKRHLREGGKFRIAIKVGKLEFSGEGKGHPSMSLSHETDAVFRRSEFVCSRTAGINCTFAAKDIPRNLVEMLLDRDAKFEVIISWDK